MTITTDRDHERLLQRDVEEDTKILSARYFRADGIPFLLEKWTADSIHGLTAVFLTEYVSGMDDDELQQFLKEHVVVELGGTTIVRRAEHVFVNFGFQAK